MAFEEGFPPPVPYSGIPTFQDSAPDTQGVRRSQIFLCCRFDPWIQPVLGGELLLSVWEDESVAGL